MPKLNPSFTDAEVGEIIKVHGLDVPRSVHRERIRWHREQIMPHFQHLMQRILERIREPAIERPHPGPAPKALASPGNPATPPSSLSIVRATITD